LTRSRLLLPLATAALLAACRDEPPSDQSGAASGEVLEGTISDAMLPLDTVRSQPPLAEPAAAARVRRGGEDEVVEDDDAEAEGAAEAEVTGEEAPATEGEEE
jgi:hypothetical protein